MATAFLPVLGRGLVRTRRCLPSTAAVSSSRAASGTLPTMVAPVPGSKIDLSASVMTLVDGKPAALALKDVFAGKKVVLFSLPGALTPTCTDSQGPEFVDAADDFAAKGVDTIACLAVDKITFLADGNAAVTKALGLDFDTGGFGGVRAVRGSYIVEDGVFSHVNVEAGGAFEGPGSAETVLKQL
jgi:glutaredoxin/glutathione-dependent peroxiredoxin